MAYRVELTERAAGDLDRLFVFINGADSGQARAWFDALEALIVGLEAHPRRGAITPEVRSLRHLIYGRGRHRYRTIYSVDERRRVVTVLHIRYGGLARISPMTCAH